MTKLDAAQRGHMADQLHELYRVANQAGPDSFDTVRASLQAIIERPQAPLTLLDPPYNLVNGTWMSADEQEEFFRRLNRDLGLGWTDEDFAPLKEAPDWPENPNGCISLTWFDGELESTFNRSVQLAFMRQLRSWVNPDLRFDAEHLRPLSGELPERGLRWCVIEDVNAGWDPDNGMVPEEFRDPKTAAGHQVPQAMLMHPYWVQQWGSRFAYPLAAGLELTYPGSQPWAYSPFFFWFAEDRQVGLYALLVGDRGHGWSVPRLQAA